MINKGKQRDIKHYITTWDMYNERFEMCKKQQGKPFILHFHQSEWML